MKKILICLLSLGGSLFAYPTHPPELASPIKALYQLKETKELLSRVEAAGNVIVKTAKLGRNASNAVWYPDERTICINTSNQRSFGSLIRSLVFELHNALNQNQFNHLDQLAMQGQISKTKYVEAVEYQEYLNAIQAAEILEKGIKNGIFPSDAYWPVAPSFSEHFRVQIEAGHSKFIGDLYDQFSWQFQNKNKKNWRYG